MSSVFSFTTDDEIIDYISPVGNSDVPYPVAYSKNNVYFMLDDQYIKRKDLELEANVSNAENLYGEFYGHIGEKQGTHEKHPVQDVKEIHKRIW